VQPRAGWPTRIRPIRRPRSPHRTVRSPAGLQYCRVMSTTPAGGGEPAEPSAGVQSVDRAISVLEILARAGVARVTDVAAELGVHKSTAFRLLTALEDRGLVEQDRERGKYRLGFGILRL